MGHFTVVVASPTKVLGGSTRPFGGSPLAHDVSMTKPWIVVDCAFTGRWGSTHHAPYATRDSTSSAGGFAEATTAWDPSTAEYAVARSVPGHQVSHQPPSTAAFTSVPSFSLIVTPLASDPTRPNATVRLSLSS